MPAFNLNPEEIESIKQIRHLNDAHADYVRRVLHDVAHEVESFTTSSAGHRAADWFLHVAEALVDQAFWRSLNNKNSFTVDDVVLIVEKAIEDAASDLREFWEDDPIKFAECYPMVQVGDNGPISHPWGDKEVATLRKWLAVRPYCVWVVYHVVQDAAKDAMEEALLDMATDVEDGSNIRRVAKEAFAKAVAAVRKDLA